MAQLLGAPLPTCLADLGPQVKARGFHPSAPPCLQPGGSKMTGQRDQGRWAASRSLLVGGGRQQVVDSDLHKITGLQPEPEHM